MEDLGFHFNPEKFYKPKGEADIESGDDSIIDGVLEEQETLKALKKRPKINIPSLSLLYLSFLIIFSLLFGRVFQLQIVKGNEYKQKAQIHGVRQIILRAPRGLIYDRFYNPSDNNSGYLLAKNIPAFSLGIIPGDLPKNQEEKDKILDKLALFLKIEKEEILKEIKEAKDPFQPVVLKKNISKNESLLLEKEFSSTPGVSVFTEPLRQYIDSEYFSHILGYVGKINAEEFNVLKDKGYDMNATIGKAGIEQFYEEYLHGQDGKELIEVDALGNVVKKLGKVEPVPGNTVITTIDSQLQKVAFDALKSTSQRVGSKKGAVVVMNPQTGEVLAMASVPSYDNNVFAENNSKEIQKLFSNPLQPLFNRVISGAYSIGSIIKPLVAIAALSEKVITPSTQFYDKGYIQISNPYVAGIVYTYKCWKAGGHGWVNLVEAIKDSCNVFFYIVGGGFENFKGLGVEKLVHWFQQFGLGQKTGIDLNGENEGFIPTPKWKKDTWGEEWYLGDTYNLSIGQGSLLATPLQAAVYTSAIANGGKILKPYLVKEILGSGKEIIFKNNSQILKEGFVNKNDLEYVKKGMLLVAKEGTAKQLSSLGVDVAAKTGTVQLGGNKEKTHSWFICFAPFQNPQIAIAVVVEKGGYGSEAALPVAQEILNFYFKNR